MNRISFKAVLLAFLLVLALDVALSFGLLALHSSQIFAGGQSDEQISTTLDMLTSGIGFLLSSLILGMLTTILGGYTAARIAKRFPYFNGLVLGVLGALIGVAFWSQYPLWLNLAGLVTALPAALLGSHLAVRLGAVVA